MGAPAAPIRTDANSRRLLFLFRSYDQVERIDLAGREYVAESGATNGGRLGRGLRLDRGI